MLAAMIQSLAENTTILAIDSSCGPCSVAVWKNGGVASYREELTASRQSARLVGMVEEALAEANITYKDLASVAVCIGPGSFTGIRIALAAARGIGFAAHIPVHGFSALDVLAFSKNAPGIVALNAGKGEIIHQSFGEKLEALSQPTLCKQDTMPNIALSDFPRADWLAGLAAAYPMRAVAPAPFYVRPPDAKIAGSA